ncbi:hypothetical protein GOODEAATRI_000350 [Goodea atripinnis]|uniref:Uncharacterized protein n=1 Tax=Goodea atripinnis TaxID=208336 RepID=A0ABV0N0P9_9TELE
MMDEEDLETSHHFLTSPDFDVKMEGGDSLSQELSDGCPSNVDTEFMDTPAYTLSIGEVSHFDLTDGSEDTSASSGSRSLVSNLVVEANDPSFASTFVNSGSRGLDQLNLGTMGQAGGGALISSSALEMGNSSGSHFSRSPPMTIDVQLSDLGHGLLEGSQLTSINPSELSLGLGGSNTCHHSDAPDQSLLISSDTQSAIKGQNPSASFGEVSKIVASMWDSLADDQKQPATVEMEISSPVIDLTTAAPSPVGQQAILRPSANSSMEANTNICGSNIILDVPEVTTLSHSGASQVTAPASVLPPGQTITKIIIPKHLLQGGGQVVTLLSGGVGAAQPTLLVSSAARQPPPLQQMQIAPPPPRLQQMAPAPPPLQAKPREGVTTLSQPVTIAATSPPPLQIKIVPASVKDRLAASVVVPSIAAAATSVQVVNEGKSAAVSGDDDVTEVLDSDEVKIITTMAL